MLKGGMGKRVWLLLILPGALFVTVFMLIPLFSIVISTFFPEDSFTLNNYGKLLQSVYFQQVFDRSVRFYARCWASPAPIISAAIQNIRA